MLFIYHVPILSYKQKSCQALDVSIERQKAQLHHTKGLRNRRPATRKQCSLEDDPLKQEEGINEQVKTAPEESDMNSCKPLSLFQQKDMKQPILVLPHKSSSPAVPSVKVFAMQEAQIREKTGKDIKKHARRLSRTLLKAKEEILKNNAHEEDFSSNTQMNNKEMAVHYRSHTADVEMSQKLSALRDELMLYIEKRKQASSAVLSRSCSADCLTLADFDISENTTSTSTPDNSRDGSLRRLSSTDDKLPHISVRKSKSSLGFHGRSKAARKESKPSSSKKGSAFSRWS